MGKKINLPIEELSKLYLSGFSFKEISKKYKCSSTTISTNLKKVGIKSLEYTLNENYFEKIDSEEKAYFLGFLYADGCVSKNNNTYYMMISLQEEDKSILEKFNKLLDSNRNLLYINNIFNNSKWKNQYKLCIGNKKLGEDLIKLGCVPKKSLILKFPTFEQVPENLIHHFIRGYFDGDGCIWEGKRYKSIVKDKTKKLGFREKIIHNVKFNITSTNDFIVSLQNILFKKANINKSKLAIRYKEKNNITKTLEQSGRNNIKKLYNFMYKDATIYLNRKKEKFESINKRANI